MSSIHANPVRFLIRTLDLTVHEKHQVLSGIKLIGKSFHKKIHKVWILRNMLIPRFCWSLLPYEISISVANHLEQKIYFYL